MRIDNQTLTYEIVAVATTSLVEIARLSVKLASGGDPVHIFAHPVTCYRDAALSRKMLRELYSSLCLKTSSLSSYQALWINLARYPIAGGTPRVTVKIGDLNVSCHICTI